MLPQLPNGRSAPATDPADAGARGAGHAGCRSGEPSGVRSRPAGGVEAQPGTPADEAARRGRWRRGRTSSGR